MSRERKQKRLPGTRRPSEKQVEHASMSALFAYVYTVAYYTKSVPSSITEKGMEALGEWVNAHPQRVLEIKAEIDSDPDHYVHLLMTGEPV